MTAGDDAEVRPELASLVPVDRDRVAELVAARGGRCACCGATDFEIGHALYLGYLFLDEDLDAYMVALTCRNPDCGRHTAIRLRESEFLTRGESEARAASWLASDPDGARPRG